ncbi:MAG: hypothetical protein NTU44_17440 [Bacteroidetes bacterium]|nr:hypothetical protein [Bacteroidota bacterium]
MRKYLLIPAVINTILIIALTAISYSCKKDNTDPKPMYPVLIDLGEELGKDTFLYNNNNQLIKIVHKQAASPYENDSMGFFYAQDRIDSVFRYDLHSPRAYKYLYNDRGKIYREYIYNWSGSGYVGTTNEYIYVNNLLYKATSGNYCIYYSFSQNTSVDTLFSDCSTLYMVLTKRYDTKHNPFNKLHLPFTFNRYDFISGRNFWKNNVLLESWESPVSPPFGDSQPWTIEYNANNYPASINGMAITYKE